MVVSSSTGENYFLNISDIFLTTLSLKFEGFFGNVSTCFFMGYVIDYSDEEAWSRTLHLKLESKNHALPYK